MSASLCACHARKPMRPMSMTKSIHERMDDQAKIRWSTCGSLSRQIWRIQDRMGCLRRWLRRGEKIARRGICGQKDQRRCSCLYRYFFHPRGVLFPDKGQRPHCPRTSHNHSYAPSPAEIPLPPAVARGTPTSPRNPILSVSSSRRD